MRGAVFLGNRKVELRTFPDLFGGGFGLAGDEHYHVSNVIFLCEHGSVIINDKTASGAAQTQHLPDGRFSSSVFVALSETSRRRRIAVIARKRWCDRAPLPARPCV